MRLDTLFKKFELFADAPNGVDKVRSIVRSLAVQGRLVPQEPTDEPARSLIERAHRERMDLAAEGLLRKVENNSHLESDGTLPPGWSLAPLAALCVAVTDGDHLPPPKADDGVPFLVISNVRWGGVSFENCRHVAQSYFDKLDWIRKPLPGDILYTLVGSFGIPVPVHTDRSFCVQRHIGILRPSKHIDRTFLAVALGSELIQRQAERIATGIAQRTIPLAGLRRISVPVPPLAEQKRIVAKVDELMALCDRLEAQQKEREEKHVVLARAALARFAEAPTPANLGFLFHDAYTIDPTDLRKSILALAVQGGLVPFEAKAGVSVGDHVDFLNGYAFKSEWFKPAGTRLCRNANVGHGALDWRDSAYVDEAIANEFVRFGLSEGDIVLSLDRPLITTGLKVARVTKDDLPCLLLQRVAKPVAKHNGIDLDYLYLWLNSPAFVDSIDPGRSNGVPHISTRQVQQLPFQLPPLREQRRIVAKVDRLMALVDRLEAQLAGSRAAAERLMDAVVGELTSSADAQAVAV